MRNVAELFGLGGEVLKRTSPDLSLETEKPNGVVLCSVKTMSESGSETERRGDCDGMIRSCSG